MRRQRQLAIILLSAIVLCVTIAPHSLAQSKLTQADKLVYQRLPQLPLGNQYISRATKQPAVENTFVGRMIRYHAFIKARPIALRLDWKHTIADYLGANELIDAASYPTQERLQQNPFEDDRAVIMKMTRSQRDQLIQALIEALGAKNNLSPAPPIAPSPVTPPPATLPPATPPPVKPLPRTAPQPGGADLLK
jgi:hypothetical protein